MEQIYLARNTKLKLIYIGKTGRNVAHRIAEHMVNKSALGSCILKDYIADWEFYIIDSAPAEDILALEAMYINITGKLYQQNGYTLLNRQIPPITNITAPVNPCETSICYQEILAERTKILNKLNAKRKKDTLAF